MSAVRFHLWPERYAVARLRALPPAALLDGLGAPAALVVVPGEISLLAPETIVDACADLASDVSRGWRALTLDAVPPFETVGLLAAIARPLAEVGVPILPLSSHDTDHFLVPEGLVGRALAALHQAPLQRFLP